MGGTGVGPSELLLRFPGFPSETRTWGHPRRDRSDSPKEQPVTAGLDFWEAQ